MKNELAKRFYDKTGLDFTDYYNELKPYYLYVIATYTKDTHIANDILNDAFYNILKYIHTFDETKSKITTWTYNILMNTMRYKHKINRIKIDYVDDYEPYNPVEDTYEQEIIEVYNVLLKIIDKDMKIKPMLREAIIMRDIMKLPYQQIADELEITLSTAKSRVFIARRMVKKIYNEKYKKL